MAVTSAIENVCSVTELQRLLAMHGYITKPGVAKVLYLALRLQKPLLLEGPPGAGKTQIAKVLSQAFNMPLIRLQCYEGIDEAKALYQWNEPLQRMALEFVRQAGEHGSWAELKGHIYSPDFLIPGPILRALQSDGRAVLLIDEIDKTGPAFEAFLLEILSDFQVSIPQLGAVVAPASACRADLVFSRPSERLSAFSRNMRMDSFVFTVTIGTIIGCCKRFEYRLPSEATSDAS